MTESPIGLQLFFLFPIAACIRAEQDNCIHIVAGERNQGDDRLELVYETLKVLYGFVSVALRREIALPFSKQKRDTALARRAERSRRWRDIP